MASIKVKLRLSAANECEGRICYQVIHKRVARYWISDYKILACEWDSRRSSPVLPDDPVRRRYLRSLAIRINLDIERFQRIISGYNLKMEEFTAEGVINEFGRQHDSQSLFRFMEEMIRRLKDNGRHRTSETYMAALNSLKRFRNDEDVMFDMFNSDLMEAYEAHLLNRGLVPNSTSFYMRILRAVFNRAVENNIVADLKPFRHVYTGVDKTKKRAVGLDVMRLIKMLDLPLRSKTAYARDIFMLSFYLRGMSFIDMAYLRKSDLKDGVLTYRRRKTGQRLSIKWTDEMQRILDRYPANMTEYLFPVITTADDIRLQAQRKQRLINSGLNAIARQIGLNVQLTLYCSRHTWASIAKMKGIPISVISEGLGHDNEQTTRIYLATLDTNVVDKANEYIISLL